MSLSQSILPEFDNEMANTRRTLERVPQEKFGWKPHEKSWSMGDLATHLSNLPSWTEITLTQESFDMNPEGEEPETATPATSTQELLDLFDENVKKAREVISSTTDENFMKPWTLLSGGETVLSLPKIGVLRSFVMNHIIHHRAQLGVYLRLNDLPVPAIYGPSADEEDTQG